MSALKKPQSLARTLLKITFIYFPVGIALTTIALAFALPSFLGCANKAKQSEAKQYLSSINRAQQAYFAETGAFSNSVNALGIGIKTQTTYYNYSTHATKNAALVMGVPATKQKKIFIAMSRLYF